MTTTLESLKSLAKQFNQHINSHDLDAALALFDDQLIDHTQPSSSAAGKNGLRGLYDMLFTASPDLTMPLEAISAEGDMVVLHGMYQGTQQGPFLGVAPTGNPFKSYVVEVFRVQNGKFVERFQWFDQTGMMRSMQTPGGSAPTMGTRAGAAPSTSSLADKKKLITTYFNEMVIPRNLDHMVDFLASDVLDHSSPPGMPGGVEGAKMFLGMSYASFPRTDYTIQHVIADGDLVTVVFLIEGAHTGTPYFGTPPSGQSFSVQCIEIERIPGNRFVEHWGGMDFMQLSAQLGLNLFGEKQRMGGQQHEAEAQRLAHQYIDGMNTGNIDVVLDVFAESYVEHQVAPGGSNLGNTKADVRRAHEMLAVAFPDVQFFLEDVLVDGDQVVMRVRGEGTHQGNFFGMPPTGKKIKWAGVRLLRYADGKFVEGNSELDQVGILQQMGILPVAPEVFDTEANKNVVRRLLLEVNAGNPNAYELHVAPDVLVHFESAETPVKGIASLRRDDAGLRSAFHDLHLEIESMTATRDTVATRVKFSGTHAGNYMGMPGTGQMYYWSGVFTDRVVDGKIVERWTNIDRFTLLMQVGIIPRFG